MTMNKRNKRLTRKRIRAATRDVMRGGRHVVRYLSGDWSRVDRQVREVPTPAQISYYEDEERPRHVARERNDGNEPGNNSPFNRRTW